MGQYGFGSRDTLAFELYVFCNCLFSNLDSPVSLFPSYKRSVSFQLIVKSRLYATIPCIETILSNLTNCCANVDLCVPGPMPNPYHKVEAQHGDRIVHLVNPTTYIISIVLLETDMSLPKRDKLVFTEASLSH